jgi:sulfotransferase
MAGLPRSGATLLSAILNQNPSLYSSPQTDLIWQMNLLSRNLLESETYHLGQLHKGYENVLKQLPQNFYAHINAPVIIDKNRSWGLSDFLELAKIINPDIKIIAPYRPILEILASFVRQCETNPKNNYIDNAVVNQHYLEEYGNMNDARCAWLMKSHNELRLNLASLRNAKSEEHKDKFLLISYDSLINNPEDSIESIYDFLELDKYQHNFNRVTSQEKYKDNEVYGLPAFHSVRETIKKNKYDIDKYLSPYIQGKYKNEDF